ncbi:hypothetical protein FLAPXU55_03099 [Flavobacterium panici]|uniref:Uncharacterized protein n=1 Tax=Flavobacterium panici TaxID=2654843 RepID=A0A9N8J4F0_9FLAO|nr:hypothetical protein FLAPXU55_03099 [Flavobacterium panici]
MEILTRINNPQNVNNPIFLIFLFLKKCSSSSKTALSRDFDIDNKLTK